MEDWTPGPPHPPCSPSSGVSGLPSSDSSDSGGPIPTVRTFQWYLGCADGTQPPRQRAAVRRGCRALPQRREDPEDDEDDNGRRRHAEDIPPRRRSLRDVIIGRDWSVESRAAEGARHWSRTPHPSGRQRAHGDGCQGRSRTRHSSRCSCRCRSRRTRSPSSLTPRGQDGTGDAGGATTKVVAVSGQADGDQQPVDALWDHDPMLPLLAEIAPKSSREAENETKRTGGEEPILGEDKVASAAELGQEKMGHLVPDAQQAPKMDLLAQSTGDDEAQASTGDQPTLVQQADCEEQHQATVQTQPIHGGEGEREKVVLSPLFSQLQPPIILQAPLELAPPGAAKTKGCGRKVVQMPSRRSGRKARFSSVPVSKRAEVRLMEEMGLLTPGEPVVDAVVEAYAKSFDTPLPLHVITGLRALTLLDGVHDMPVPGEKGTTATAVV
ncbi:hypothetical protein OsI_33928 [Oryza sativa Indica Group]|uniref:Uncharacterized protein n=1 Tax=Oryza sativa subsp. indica TaxID=39946 RepID=B8BHC2_ORYSI|nr:hypothetical protein OsI_33928 [Oryza sativa Indica Group]